MTNPASPSAPARGELEGLVVASVFLGGTTALVGLPEQTRSLLSGEWRHAFDAALELARRGEVGPDRIPPELAEAEVRRVADEHTASSVRVVVDACLDTLGEQARRPDALRHALKQLRDRAGGPARFDLAKLSVAHHLAEEAHTLDHGVQHVPSGWPRLDQALGGGFTLPSLNVLGAAPKSGKSTWAQHVATHHLERGGAVLYVDLENGRRRYLRQLLCRRAELGSKAVAQAMGDQRAGVFSTRADAERWQAAKAWVAGSLGRLWIAFRPPDDWEACLRAAKSAAGDAPLLVVVDSLQKLPGDLKERRATVDGWILLFERLRHELDAVFLVVSEIRRGKEGYRPSEDAFKESGGIEYGGDLLLTMDRPTAEDDDEAVATLTVQLARDTDEDPRGDVASYRAVRPHYGLEELDPAPRRKKGRSGPRAEARGAAEAFLRDRLATGPVHVSELLAGAKAAGVSESSVRRAGREIGLVQCTLSLKTAWRLP